MSEPRLTGGLSPTKTALLGAGILLVAAAVVAIIFSTEPEAKREGAVKKSAMLVDVVEVEVGSFRPEIVALGEVRPAEDTTLAPQVSGAVIERASAFDPGRFVAAGETLLRLEPADYRHALAQARSALADAQAALALEEGQQTVARAERSAAARELSPAQEALVLRGPQLQAARARVEAARATVAQAELDLARTRVTAPFDAQVLARDASLGDQVAAGAPVGRLVGLDTWQVMATLPVAALSRLALPGAAAPPSPVQVRDRAAWPDGASRSGVLAGVLPALDDGSRMARVLVEVQDPLARAPETTGPAMVSGAWVEVRFEGAPLDDVARLDRDLLRKDDTVWVMEDEVLRIRAVELAAVDARHAYVTAGLSPGDRVVTTHLSTVTDGAPLRLAQDAAPDDPAAEGDE